MPSAYQTLVAYEKNDWEGLFSSLGVQEVFADLLDEFTAPDSCRKIVRYILWTYSACSERLVAHSDWEENKRNNFNQAGLPGDLWNQIGLLQDEIVLTAVHKWLEYQDIPLFKELQCLRDLKMEMQLSANSGIRKGSGTEIDYDQKFKNAEYSIELTKMIQQLENQSIANNPLLRDAVKETAFQKRKTVGAETFAQ